MFLQIERTMGSKQTEKTSKHTEKTKTHQTRVANFIFIWGDQSITKRFFLRLHHMISKCTYINIESPD
jgi:hypothetical protein